MREVTDDTIPTLASLGLPTDFHQDDVQEFMGIAGQPVGNLLAPALTPMSGERERIALVVAARLCHFAADILKEAANAAPHSRALRGRFIAEETGEFLDAMATDDLPGAADALGDLEYVIKGAGVSFGIDLGPVWEAIHNANMAKFKCVPCNGKGFLDAEEPAQCENCGGSGVKVLRDAGGKTMKPPGWTPPDIAAVLAAQGKPRPTTATP